MMFLYVGNHQEGTNILSNSVYYPSYLKQVQGINKMVLYQTNTDRGIFTFDLTWKEIQILKRKSDPNWLDSYGNCIFFLKQL